MDIGYERVSKADGSQTTDMQHDALLAAGIDPTRIYTDHISSRTESRPGLENCLRACREGDVLHVWKLDRLGRNTQELIQLVADIEKRGVGLKTLSGTQIDTTTPHGKLVFTIFAALAEFERELIRERTKAGLAAARSRGRVGGAPFKMTAAKLRLAMAAMGQTETVVADLCKELGVTRQTLYRHVAPDGSVRDDGKKLLEKSRK